MLYYKRSKANTFLKHEYARSEESASKIARLPSSVAPACV